MGREMGRTAAIAMRTTARCSRCIATLCALLLILACRGGSSEKPEKPLSMLSDTFSLLPGDLLFRRGTSLSSEAVIMADRRGEFSHVGIVADSAGVMMVVHAVPDEPDFKGDPDRVKMETPASFFTTDKASKGVVCRPNDAEAGKRAAKVALETYRRGTLFDHKYNSEDTTTMYCTELVVHCYRKAGYELTGPPTHSYSMPILSCTCWLPSDLYHSEGIHEIFLMTSGK